MQIKKTEGKEREITKEEFKALYFKYATPDSGWTKDYWNKFFEKEKGKKYFFSEPRTPESTRMFIVMGDLERRMVFFSEDTEESFFKNPGKGR